MVANYKRPKAGAQVMRRCLGDGCQWLLASVVDGLKFVSIRIPECTQPLTCLVGSFLRILRLNNTTTT